MRRDGMISRKEKEQSKKGHERKETEGVNSVVIADCRSVLAWPG
jgi:hypothetical protein